jgi:hypothetical protein
MFEWIAGHARSVSSQEGANLVVQSSKGWAYYSFIEWADLCRKLAKAWEDHTPLNVAVHERFFHAQFMRLALDLDWDRNPPTLDHEHLKRTLCKAVSDLLTESFKSKKINCRATWSIWWNASTPEKVSYRVYWPWFVVCKREFPLVAAYLKEVMEKERLPLVDSSPNTAHLMMRMPLSDKIGDDNRFVQRPFAVDQGKERCLRDGAGMVVTEAVKEFDAGGERKLDQLVFHCLVAHGKNPVGDKDWSQGFQAVRKRREVEVGATRTANLVEEIQARREREAWPNPLNFRDREPTWDSVDTVNLLAQIIQEEQYPYPRALTEINARCMIVTGPGEAKVMLKVWNDEDQLFMLMEKSASNFLATFPSPKIELENEDKPKSIFRYWFESLHRNIVDGFIFQPQARSEFFYVPPKPPRMFNLFQGWKWWREEDVETKHFNRERGEDPSSALSIYKTCDSVRMVVAHIHHSLCNGDFQATRVFLCILANLLHYPGSPPEKGVIIQGDEGVGKTIIFKHLQRHILGIKHAKILENPRDITGQFNEMLSGTICLVAEEACFADPAAAPQIQALITGDHVTVNAKGHNQRQERCFLFPFFLTNRQFPLAVNATARRYIVLETNPEIFNWSHERKKNYFNNLADHCLSGHNIYQFACFLEALPLHIWWNDNKKSVVVTNQALANQVIHSLRKDNPTLFWWHQCLLRGKIGGKIKKNVTRDGITKEEEVGWEKQFLQNAAATTPDPLLDPSPENQQRLEPLVDYIDVDVDDLYTAFSSDPAVRACRSATSLVTPELFARETSRVFGFERNDVDNTWRMPFQLAWMRQRLQRVLRGLDYEAMRRSTSDAKDVVRKRLLTGQLKDHFKFPQPDLKHIFMQDEYNQLVKEWERTHRNQTLPGADPSPDPSSLSSSS